MDSEPPEEVPILNDDSDSTLNNINSSLGPRLFTHDLQLNNFYKGYLKNKTKSLQNMNRIIRKRGFDSVVIDNNSSEIVPQKTTKTDSQSKELDVYAFEDTDCSSHPIQLRKVRTSIDNNTPPASTNHSVPANDSMMQCSANRVDSGELLRIVLTAMQDHNYTSHHLQPQKVINFLDNTPRAIAYNSAPATEMLCSANGVDSAELSPIVLPSMEGINSLDNVPKSIFLEARTSLDITPRASTNNSASATALLCSANDVGSGELSPIVLPARQEINFTLNVPKGKFVKVRTSSDNIPRVSSNNSAPATDCSANEAESSELSPIVFTARPEINSSRYDPKSNFLKSRTSLDNTPRASTNNSAPETADDVGSGELSPTVLPARQEINFTLNVPKGKIVKSKKAKPLPHEHSDDPSCLQPRLHAHSSTSSDAPSVPIANQNEPIICPNIEASATKAKPVPWEHSDDPSCLQPCLLVHSSISSAANSVFGANQNEPMIHPNIEASVDNHDLSNMLISTKGSKRNYELPRAATKAKPIPKKVQPPQTIIIIQPAADRPYSDSIDRCLEGFKDIAKVDKEHSKRKSAEELWDSFLQNETKRKKRNLMLNNIAVPDSVHKSMDVSKHKNIDKTRFHKSDTAFVDSTNIDTCIKEEESLHNTEARQLPIAPGFNPAQTMQSLKTEIKETYSGFMNYSDPQHVGKAPATVNTIPFTTANQTTQLVQSVESLDDVNANLQNNYLIPDIVGYSVAEPNSESYGQNEVVIGTKATTDVNVPIDSSEENRATSPPTIFSIPKPSWIHSCNSGTKLSDSEANNVKCPNVADDYSLVSDKSQDLLLDVKKEETVELTNDVTSLQNTAFDDDVIPKIEGYSVVEPNSEPCCRNEVDKDSKLKLDVDVPVDFSKGNQITNPPTIFYINRVPWTDDNDTEISYCGPHNAKSITQADKEPLAIESKDRLLNIKKEIVDEPVPFPENRCNDLTDQDLLPNEKIVNNNSDKKLHLISSAIEMANRNSWMNYNDLSSVNKLDKEQTPSLTIEESQTIQDVKDEPEIVNDISDHDLETTELSNSSATKKTDQDREINHDDVSSLHEFDDDDDYACSLTIEESQVLQSIKDEPDIVNNIGSNDLETSHSTNSSTIEMSNLDRGMNDYDGSSLREFDDEQACSLTTEESQVLQGVKDTSNAFLDYNSDTLSASSDDNKEPSDIVESPGNLSRKMSKSLVTVKNLSDLCDFEKSAANTVKVNAKSRFGIIRRLVKSSGTVHLNNNTPCIRLADSLSASELCLDAENQSIPKSNRLSAKEQNVDAKKQKVCFSSAERSLNVERQKICPSNRLSVEKFEVQCTRVADHSCAKALSEKQTLCPPVRLCANGISLDIENREFRAPDRLLANKCSLNAENENIGLTDLANGPSLKQSKKSTVNQSDSDLLTDKVPVKGTRGFGIERRKKCNRTTFVEDLDAFLQRDMWRKKKIFCIMKKVFDKQSIQNEKIIENIGKMSKIIQGDS